MNRAVDRRRIFHTANDYWAFIDVLQDAAAKGLVTVVSYNVLPNHWHLVVIALTDTGVSEFMKWLTGTHARRYRDFYGTKGYGHLYKDRFKATIVEDEAAYIRVMRYVEANAACAKLTDWPQNWPWCSAFERQHRHRSILGPSPYQLPENWCKLLAAYVSERLGTESDQ